MSHRFWNIVLVLLAVSSVLSSCSEGSSGGDGGAEADVGSDSGSWSDGRYVSPELVYERFTAADGELLLVNVVDEEFYDLGHVEGSIVVPWDLLDGREHEVDPGRDVVIYCRLGVRSEAAYATLESAGGYERLWIMEGGITAWKELGYPTVEEP